MSCVEAMPILATWFLALPLSNSTADATPSSFFVFSKSADKAEKLKKSMLNRRIKSRTIHNADGGEQVERPRARDPAT